MKDKFIQFLKERNIYDRFLDNLQKTGKTSVEEHCEYVPPYMYVSYAFPFDIEETTDGLFFWMSVVIDWDDYRYNEAKNEL